MISTCDDPSSMIPDLKAKAKQFNQLRVSKKYLPQVGPNWADGQYWALFLDELYVAPGTAS